MLNLDHLARLVSSLQHVSYADVRITRGYEDGRLYKNHQELEVDIHVRTFSQYRSVISALKRLLPGTLKKSLTGFGGVRLQSEHFDVWVFIDSNVKEVILSEIFKCNIREITVQSKPTTATKYVCERAQ